VEGNAGTTQAVFSVTRSSGAGLATVDFATADGSSTAGSGDYQPAAGTLTFLPGETRKTVAVTVNGDRLGESDESFVLNLSNPSGGSVIADGQGRANIPDDEPRIHATGLLAFPEGDKTMTLHLAVNLSELSSETVTVHYATADLTTAAGIDYLPVSGVLTFAPGEARKIIDITLPKDMTPDAIVEAFVVNFSEVSSNAVILKRGVVHIVDDGENSQGNHFGNPNGGPASVGFGFASTVSGFSETPLDVAPGHPMALSEHWNTQVRSSDRKGARSARLITEVPSHLGTEAESPITHSSLFDLIHEDCGTQLLDELLIERLMIPIRGR
jgi:hypothetical protein